MMEMQCNLRFGDKTKTMAAAQSAYPIQVGFANTPDGSSVITAYSFRSERLYDPMILRDVCSRRSKPQLFLGEL